MVMELKGITHAYNGKPVIKGLSLGLERGERVALTGSNGSGKSTLMHIAMGLVRPTGGEVYAFGRPCATEEDFMTMRRRVGFLFQDSEDQLFCPTVEEDVAFGPLNLGLTHEEARVRVEETLGRLGISHLRRSVTHRLSGGEKRLVAFATIAAMRPEAYILDEPTGGLDARGRDTVRKFIMSSVHTALISSHDEDFMKEVTSRSVGL